MSHLRRKDREITDTAQIDEILTSGRYAVIALADGEEPYVVTLSYGYDAERRRLCFHAAGAGRKLDIIASNPRASVTVINDLGYSTGECAHRYQSVVMSGTMRVIDGLEEARDAMLVLVDHLESPEDRDAVWQRNKLADDAVYDRLTIVEFVIDGMCAKQGQ